MKINGLMLGSDNPKQLGEFYSKILGEPGFRDDDWYGFQLGGGLMIGAHSEVTGKNTMPARMMLILEVDDVKAEFNRITGLGGQAIAKPYQPNAKDQPTTWLATVADPDGNYIQLSLPWPT